MKKLLLVFVLAFVFSNIIYATTINLTWDGANTTPTSCTYGGTFVPPTPAPRTGYVFNGWKVKTINSIPNTYTQLEYLQSNGNQYINTGVAKYTSGNTYRLASKVSWANVSTRQLHGCQDGFYYGVINGYLQIVHSGNYRTDIHIYSDTAYDINAFFDPINKKVNFQVNGQSYTLPATIFDPNTGYGNSVDGKSFAVFSLNDRILPFGTSKVYYYTLYKNDIKVFNGIPAKRNSDNVIGMYDTVSETFFTNAGSGTFTAGPAIQ